MSTAIESLVERVGNTPLVRLRQTESGLGAVRLYAKLEHLNPGGSIKDRVALESLRRARLEGRVGPGRPMVALGGGNLGIAYAWVGAALGISVRLVAPEGASAAHVRIARAYGAQIEIVSGEEAARREIERSGFALEAAQASVALGSMAEEMILQAGGELTHVVAGIGSGATAARLRDASRRLGRGLRVVGVAPAGGSSIPGLGRAASLDLDETIEIPASEAREQAARLLAGEGLLVGPSSGAAVAGALAVARRLQGGGQAGSLAVVLADRGERYVELGRWEERFRW